MGDPDLDGDTPMHVGAMHSNVQKSCLWLAANGQMNDLLKENKDGLTPLAQFAKMLILLTASGSHDLRKADGTYFCDEH